MRRSHRHPRIEAIAVLSCALVASAAAGQESRRASAEEAQAMVASAVALYESAGREAAFAAIEAPNEEFIDRDLYVFVFGPERAIVAHGGDPGLVGTPAADLQDSDGVRFGDLFMDEATAEGVWIDYRWQDPLSGEIQPKSSWVVLHDGHVFGAGIYRE